MAVAILAVQVLLVSLGVISRHFSKFVVGRSLSLSFTEELSRYLLAWVTAFGLCAVLREEGLLALHVWPGRFGRFRRILAWIGVAATFGLALLIVIEGARVVALQWMTDKRTGVMGWPMVWVTVSLPLGMLLTTSVSSEIESGRIAKYKGIIRDDEGRAMVQTSLTLYSATDADVKDGTA